MYKPSRMKKGQTKTTSSTSLNEMCGPFFMCRPRTFYRIRCNSSYCVLPLVNGRIDLIVWETFA
jgi:hypothetical protein